MSNHVCVVCGEETDSAFDAEQCTCSFECWLSSLECEEVDFECTICFVES